MQTLRIPALDGIRALAVCAVLLGHLAPVDWLRNLVGYGDAGVVAFFCLSGFLITRILLSFSCGSRVEFLRSFYSRRFLRIVPIYALVLAACYFGNYTPAKLNLLRLATYSIGVPFLPPTALGNASHLWSLSVEEQFYLFWPVVILYSPRRHLLPISLSVVGASFIAKLAIAYSGGGYGHIFRPLYGCMDSLGLGSTIAIIVEGDFNWRNSFVSKQLLGFVVAVASCTWGYRVAFVDHRFTGHLAFGIIQMASLALALSLLILHIVCIGDGLVDKFLSLRVFGFIAKISYGLYLYHFFLPVAINQTLYALGYRLRADSGSTICALAIPLAFAVATVSWYAIEKPILSAKWVHREPFKNGDMKSVEEKLQHS